VYLKTEDQAMLRPVPKDAPPEELSERLLPPFCKQEALKSIMTAGFPMDDFKPLRTLSPEDDTKIFTALSHGPTGSYFIFGGTTYKLGQVVEAMTVESFTSYYYPGLYGTRTEKQAHATVDQQILRFRQWLGIVKGVVGISDFWKAIEDTPSLPRIATETDNTKFTLDERRNLTAALEKIERRVADLAISSEVEHASIHAQFKDLRDSLKNLGRRSWWNLLLGTLASYVMRAELDAAGARELISFASSRVAEAFGPAVALIAKING
jgi:hypothetical protein